MKRSITTMLSVIAVASTLAACAGTQTAQAEKTPMACSETGLTNAKDSKMGQLECTPVTAGATPSAK